MPVFAGIVEEQSAEPSALDKLTTATLTLAIKYRHFLTTHPSKLTAETHIWGTAKFPPVDANELGGGYVSTKQSGSLGL